MSTNLLEKLTNEIPKNFALLWSVLRSPSRYPAEFATKPEAPARALRYLTFMTAAGSALLFPIIFGLPNLTHMVFVNVFIYVAAGTGFSMGASLALKALGSIYSVGEVLAVSFLCLGSMIVMSAGAGGMASGLLSLLDYDHFRHWVASGVAEGLGLEGCEIAVPPAERPKLFDGLSNILVSLQPLILLFGLGALLANYLRLVPKRRWKRVVCVPAIIGIGSPCAFLGLALAAALPLPEIECGTLLSW